MSRRGAPLLLAVRDVVVERVDADLLHIGVGLEIVGCIEVGRGISVLVGAVGGIIGQQRAVGQLIELGCVVVLIEETAVAYDAHDAVHILLGQTFLGMSSGGASLILAVAYIVVERIHPRLGYIGVLLEVVGSVELRGGVHVQLCPVAQIVLYQVALGRLVELGCVIYLIEQPALGYLGACRPQLLFIHRKLLETDVTSSF